MLPKRNILYQTKKSLLQDEKVEEPQLSYKQQRDNLRNLLRRKQADIIRLESQNDALKLKVQQQQAEYRTWKLESTNYESLINGPPDSLISQAKTKDEILGLKLELQAAQKNNLELNAIKNQSQRDCRQLIAQNQKMRRRIRQLQIIEQMRRERFEQQVKSLQPIIINTNQSDQLLTSGNQLLIQTLRSGIVKIITDVFVNSASLSDKRRVNSTIIFKTSINQLRKSAQRNGLILLCKIYSNLKDLVRIVDNQYGQLQTPETRTQFNDWLQRSIVGVKMGKESQKSDEQSLYLFRLLALHYRSKYPLKGETQQIDRDIEVVLQDLIVNGLFQLIAKI